MSGQLNNLRDDQDPSLQTPWATEDDIIPQWMWARREHSERPKSPKGVWQGGFSDRILGARRPPKVFHAPKVEQWQPRGQSFYADLRKEEPKKYSGKGVHRAYGGEVVCHPREELSVVHVDKERDAERKALEPGSRECFSGGESMANCVERLRESEQSKARAGRGRGKKGLPSEGGYLEEMNRHGMFFSSADRLGHQAPGHALGAAGSWGRPPAMRERRGERKDLRGRGGEGASTEARQWTWHADNVK